MTKNKRMFSFLMDERVERMINEIKDDRALGSITEVLKYCIKETHDDIFLDYRRQKADAPKRPKYADPLERIEAEAKKKEEEAQAKLALEMKRALAICQSLDGKVITEPHGAKTCHFTNYEKVGQRVIKSTRKVYFENLHQTHIDKQYTGGTREEIEALLADPSNA